MLLVSHLKRLTSGRSTCTAFRKVPKIVDCVDLENVPIYAV